MMKLKVDVKTVRDFENLINGPRGPDGKRLADTRYALYLGFDKLGPDEVLKEIKTDAKRKINIVDELRVKKLLKESWIPTNYVYYVELEKKNRLSILGVKFGDLEDPTVEDEEFDEFTPIQTGYMRLFLNKRYPDYSNFILFDDVKIHTNKYNFSNGVLAQIAPTRYLFVADMIILFTFPEEIIDFYSLEVNFFPDFFVRSANYVYFINQDKLMRYNSKFNATEFEAKYFIKNYRPQEHVPNRVVIADAANIYQFEDAVPDVDTMLTQLLEDLRITNTKQVQEKLEIADQAEADEVDEFDYDEYFEVTYF